MSTPTETVAEAVARAGYRYPSDIASTALASLRQHRDDIARVLFDSANPANARVGWDHVPDWIRDSYRTMADALLDFLDGGK